MRGSNSHGTSLHPTVFKTAPVACYRVDLPYLLYLARETGLEPAQHRIKICCLNQFDYSLTVWYTEAESNHLGLEISPDNHAPRL